VTSICTNCTHEVHDNKYTHDGLLFCSARCLDGYRIKAQASLIRRLQRQMAVLNSHAERLAAENRQLRQYHNTTLAQRKPEAHS
jgi:hypothetical protein